MAATNFTPISLYYSSTASAAPTAGNLVAGELAINTADGKLFYKDSAGVVQVIGTKGGVGSSTTTQVLYNSSGLVVGSANMTFNGTTLTLANDASISGLTVGKGGGSVATNTAFGYQSLNGSNSGTGYNTATGYQTLYSNTTGQLNTAVGNSALYTNTTGSENQAFGRTALYLNTTGSSNVAVGSDALRQNTTASNNTAVGYQAAYSNVTGTDIVAIGFQAYYAGTVGYTTAVGRQALTSNTTGAENQAFGYNALYTNTTGSNNTAIGRSALFSNTTASNCTAVGYQAGYSNTTGLQTTAVGYQSLYSTTTTGYSTAVGYQAGYSATSGIVAAFGQFVLKNNTTGNANAAFGGFDGTNTQTMASNTTGSNNSAFGMGALAANTTASNNTAVGYQAGYTNQTGAFNAYFGRAAGYLATGGQNTFIGDSSGYNATGTLNSYLGSGAGVLMTSGSKNTIVGAYSGNTGGLDIRTASNYIVLSDGDGNPRGFYNNSTSAWELRNNVNIEISVGINALSASSSYDLGIGTLLNSRDGIRIQTFNSAGSGSYLSFRNLSNAVAGSITHTGTTTVAYNTSSDYRLKENVKPMVGALAKVAQLKPCTYTWKEDGTNGEGFIAHELQQICPQAVTFEKDAVDAEGNPKYQGMDTSFLVATLTAAIQELNAKLEAQALEIATLKGK